MNDKQKMTITTQDYNGEDIELIKYDVDKIIFSTLEKKEFVFYGVKHLTQKAKDGKRTVDFLFDNCQEIITKTEDITTQGEDYLHICNCTGSPGRKNFLQTMQETINGLREENKRLRKQYDWLIEAREEEKEDNEELVKNVLTAFKKEMRKKEDNK